MNKVLKLLLVLSFAGLSNSALAGRNHFCAGFEDGYKAVKGSLVLVPICPYLVPLTPVGATDYQKGVKAGALKAMEKELDEKLNYGW